MLAPCWTFPQRISIRHLSCTIWTLEPIIFLQNMLFLLFFSCINWLHHSHPRSSDLKHLQSASPLYPPSSRAVSKSYWIFLNRLISSYLPTPTPIFLIQAFPNPPPQPTPALSRWPLTCLFALFAFTYSTMRSKSITVSLSITFSPFFLSPLCCGAVATSACFEGPGMCL